MDHLLSDRNFVGAACETVQTLKLHLHGPTAPLKGFWGREKEKNRREGEEMEEEKQRRKEENKEVSSCYQVQQQPAGTVIPEVRLPPFLLQFTPSFLPLFILCGFCGSGRVNPHWVQVGVVRL